MKIAVVIGARPNVVKVAPVVKELESRGHQVTIVHTQQHYDDIMNSFIFEDLGLREPDHNLLAGKVSGRSRRLGRITSAMGGFLSRNRHDACMVAGDVDSTLGAALGAEFSGTPIIHLESGLRSGNWTMPEEVNRFLVDHVSDLMLCTTRGAAGTLFSEGAHGTIRFVGNTMIDSLMAAMDSPDRDDRAVLREHGLVAKGYCVCTFHRASLVDDPFAMGTLQEALNDIAAYLKVVVAVHPRTVDRFDAKKIQFELIDPQRYLPFVSLMANARFVITDSGGVQEETTFLKTPCLTYRHETERPSTLKGSNVLVGCLPDELVKWGIALATGKWHAGEAPEMWDGDASGRVVDCIEGWFANFRQVPGQTSYKNK